MSRITTTVRHIVAISLLLILTACAAQPHWEHHLQADHPLTGKIWDVAHSRFISEKELLDHLAAADFVLLGEKHDNLDHHRLQARVVRDLAARGWRPRVGFEMIGRDKTPLVTAYLKHHPKNASGLGAAVEWEKSGWPDWSIYQPIADAALLGGGSVMALNLPRQETREVMSKGLGIVDDEITGLTGLDKPLPKPIAEQLDREIRASHCGQIPEALVGKMSLAQRARDAVMAFYLAEQPDTDRSKTVLIAGTGHTRKDRGVPYYLKNLRPNAKIVNLAFREVEGSDLHAKDYADAASEDFVWFTPRVDEDDPCDRFKEQIRNMKKKG